MIAFSDPFEKSIDHLVNEYLGNDSLVALREGVMVIAPVREDGRIQGLLGSKPRLGRKGAKQQRPSAKISQLPCTKRLKWARVRAKAKVKSRELTRTRVSVGRRSGRKPHLRACSLCARAKVVARLRHWPHFEASLQPIEQ